MAQQKTPDSIAQRLRALATGETASKFTEKDVAVIYDAYGTLVYLMGQVNMLTGKIQQAAVDLQNRRSDIVRLEVQVKDILQRQRMAIKAYEEMSFETLAKLKAITQ